VSLTPEERDRRTRECLLRLREGRHNALAVCGDLIDLGYPAATAWYLVEEVIKEVERKRE
jgi:hypothetical protein